MPVHAWIWSDAQSWGVSGGFFRHALQVQNQRDSGVNVLGSGVHSALPVHACVCSAGLRKATPAKAPHRPPACCLD